MFGEFAPSWLSLQAQDTHSFISPFPQLPSLLHPIPLYPIPLLVWICISHFLPRSTVELHLFSQTLLCFLHPNGPPASTTPQQTSDSSRSSYQKLVDSPFQEIVEFGRTVGEARSPTGGRVRLGLVEWKQQGKMRNGIRHASTARMIPSEAKGNDVVLTLGHSFHRTRYAPSCRPLLLLPFPSTGGCRGYARLLARCAAA